MNNQDYDQKKRECWDDYTRKCAHEGKSAYGAFCFAFDRAYVLGKQEKDAEDDKTLKVNRQLFCRLCADADDYINEHLEEEDNDYGYYQGRSDALHELYRGECKDAEETVISGWVARDKGGFISLFSYRPDRVIHDDLGSWGRDDGSDEIDLPKSSFPDLTWESDPLPVEIIIKKKKNG